MMPTIEDLGRKIKAKYPGEYDDLSDAEVGRRIKAKFPGAYDDFEEQALQRNVVMHEPDRTASNVQSLIDYYSPKRGRFTSWWQHGKSESRTRLLTVLNQEQLFVIQQGAILEDAIRNKTKTESDFHVYLARNAATLMELQLKNALIQAALAQGYTVETDQKLKLESGLSGIRLNEHEERTKIDLDARWKEILQDSNAADLALIGDHLVIKKLREELIQARRERHAIKTGDDPEPLKRELLKDYKKFISRLEAKIDERETGYLLSQNQKEAKGLGEGTPESRPDYPPETPEDAN
jgi:hypothetical protein